MNLKGLFQKLKLPSFGGKKASNSSENQPVSHFHLVLTNIENSPSYALETELSIGSEAADIQIEDESLSPKHAVFKLQDGVVTVTDLGSEAGTRLGDHVLTKAKALILKDGDVLQLGQIEVTLKVEVVSVPQVRKVSGESPKEEKEKLEDPVEESVPESDEIAKPEDKMKKRIEEMRAKNKGKSPSRKSIGGGASKAANSLPRAVGVGFDVLLTLIIWQIFSGFDEFKSLLEIVPQILQHDVLPILEALMKDFGFEKDYQFALTTFLDLVSDLENELQLSHLLSLLITIRILTTLLFGVTLGSWLAGVRAFGNVIWKRFGGVLREIIGLVTFPFLIFDLPTLFSRRSLKEVLTFTHLYSQSKSIVIISWLLFFPITLAAVFISPMFEGLELTLPIEILEQNPGRKNKKSETPETIKAYSSEWFGVEFRLPQESWKVVPRFAWTQEAGRGRALTPTLVFYHQTGTTIPLVLHKTFDWKPLLSTALAHNFPLQLGHPKLWSFIQASKVKGTSLKYNPSPQDKLALQSEIQELIRAAFNLSPETFLEHAQTHGPLIKGLVEFRREFLKMVGATEDGIWSFIKFGKSTMLVHEVGGVKPYDILIPLVVSKGRLFKVSYASPKERAATSRLANADVWRNSNWELPDGAVGEGSAIAIDVVAKIAGGGEVTDDDLEKIYGSFFELCAPLADKPIEDAAKANVLKALKNMEEIVLKLSKKKNLSEGSVQSLVRMHQKLAELRGQLESNNAVFFNPEPAPAAVLETQPAPAVNVLKDIRNKKKR